MKKIYFLVFFFLFLSSFLYSQNKNYQYSNEGIIRLDISKKIIYLCFTGHDFSDGGKMIAKILKKNKISASFFFTGDFYRNPANKKIILDLIKQKNYMGPHSDKHLLYCDWEKRDSTLVSEDSFKIDLSKNYKEMIKFGIKKNRAKYFIPPYEWYNKTIVKWANDIDLQIVNFTPGTYSNADYTTPDMGKRYVNSDTIFNRILNYEQKDEHGLNGFMLLLHIGTDPKRTDKMYYKFDTLIMALKKRGYVFKNLNDIK
jgi:peptidoglycan/xylan/chitin deacetylase (PgdA/CDA1 family)